MRRPGVLLLTLVKEYSLGRRFYGAAIRVDLLVLGDVRYLWLGLRQQSLRVLKHLIAYPISYIFSKLVQITLTRQFVLLGKLRYLVHLSLEVTAHLVEKIFFVYLTLLALLFVHLLFLEQS